MKTSTAHGKIMLAGEYAVLFGKKALVLAVDRTAICTFASAPRFNFLTKTVGEFIEDASHPMFMHARAACKQAGFDAIPGTYALDTSSLFQADTGLKLGLGSSSAGVVALCKLILGHHGINDADLLFATAYLAHRNLNQKLGSGADVAAATFGGLIAFCRHDNEFSVTHGFYPPLLDEIIFVHTGRAQCTAFFVERVMALRASAQGFVADFCERTSALTEELLKATVMAQVITLFYQLNTLLDSLGAIAGLDIITKEHKEIHEAAKALGGSAKPSGAGGGDISLAAVPRSNREIFHDKMKQLGFTALRLCTAAPSRLSK